MHREVPIERVVELAVEAGKAIRKLASDSVDVDLKGDGSPVTRADRVSHGIIVKGLRVLTPEIPLISEEDEEAVPPGEKHDTFWLVDPLDGTKEFIAGNGEYTVNIALIYQNQPVMGVIYAPEVDRLYWAEAGSGSFRVDSHGSPARISACGTSLPITAVVSRSHPSADTEAVLSALSVAKRIPLGSSLKFCAVADGTADIYVRMGPTCLWDSAAGVAIAREAGARAVDKEGHHLVFDPRRGLLHPCMVTYSTVSCPLELDTPIPGAIASA